MVAEAIISRYLVHMESSRIDTCVGSKSHVDSRLIDDAAQPVARMSGT